MARRNILLGLLALELIAGLLIITIWTPQPPQGGAAEQIDVTRLPDLKDDLSKRFSVDVRPPQTISQEEVDKTKAELTPAAVTPAECAGAAAQANWTAGTLLVSLAVGGDQGWFLIDAAQYPQPVPAKPVDNACREFTAEWPDGAATMTNVITPPAIAGAETLATHSTYATTSPLDGQPHAVDRYVYTARLDDRHIVTVTSSANPRDSQTTAAEAQRLLVQAVDTVRRKS